MRVVKALNQTGDTIVEVLIAMAVISLVLVGAYRSTNRNIANTQDAQERSQAVKLVETQIEYLRSAGSITSGYCFVGGQESSPGVSGSGSDPCTVAATGDQAKATDVPAYTLQIQTTPTAGVYSISANWQGLSNKSLSNVTMYYQP